jgi:hypothetical protein
MKRMATALAIWMAASACTGMPPEPNDGPGITGSIQQIEAAHAPPRVLVAGDVWVEVTGDTELWERSGGRLQRIEYAALQVGDSVHVWYSGPIRESYPAQAVAATIIVEH